MARASCIRRLAIDQPSFSAPTRSATATGTSSKNTWLKSCCPARSRIGETVRPGLFMSTSRKVSPCWRRAPSAVRKMPNIRLARWAPVVQIFVPVMR
ncbi:hypothetical protein ASD38_19740 [Caulobacter sp. Root487D2Y]|nr:hypothetical protein ASD38_19740 [Caulobacter sp. Root487D2Y]